jgi:prepilin-type N-terminal cleavage/methylation domain-containing protein
MLNTMNDLRNERFVRERSASSREGAAQRSLGDLHDEKLSNAARLRKGAGWRRKGFTLVEVIVVLVILAILAAIAIPALTGYIEKAQEKQYIADARNHIEAVRTVLAESYSDGEMLSTPVAVSYVTNGDATDQRRTWSLVKLGGYLFASDATRTFMRRASVLISEPFPPEGFDNKNTKYWTIGLFSDKASSDTMLNAPGFTYQFYPEGNKAGKEVVLVTYGLPRFDTSKMTTWGDYAFHNQTTPYKADAGYEVYHLDCSTDRVSSV